LSISFCESLILCFSLSMSWPLCFNWKSFSLEVLVHQGCGYLFRNLRYFLYLDMIEVRRLKDRTSILNLPSKETFIAAGTHVSKPNRKGSLQSLLNINKWTYNKFTAFLLIVKNRTGWYNNKWIYFTECMPIQNISKFMPLN